MVLEIKKFLKAHDLPECWDSICSNYIQKKDFLSYLELYNPCNQRYYAGMQNNEIKIGIVIYNLKLNLFTYSFFKFQVKMNIAGIPCSVSSGGVVGDYVFFPELYKYLINETKGLLLFLNIAESEFIIKDYICGETLPAVIIKNYFSSWEDYLDSLKSHYRRRYNLISREFQEVVEKETVCSCFNEEMFKMYLEVLSRSKGKLESLKISFFQNLPDKFKLNSFYTGNKLLGWFITFFDNSIFYFFLGGIDYELNEKYQIYFNLLYRILKDGIEKKAKAIDMGQTAEIPKMRLGGKLQKKYMIGYHNNTILRLLMKLNKNLLSYKYNFNETNVTKIIK
ncbi:MAG: GNAT family N-acetyltransferase [Spirochaetes bacterium]|nr:GNAT family N-acetyltransferase [Spirochaetota bacterium]